MHPAHYSIDLNLHTEAHADKDNNNQIWLKVNLDQVYCVHQVIELDDGSSTEIFQFSWTCSRNNCDECETTRGDGACERMSLSVSRSYTGPISSDDSCKLGNTVTLEKFDNQYRPLKVTEIAIFGRKGGISR